MYFFKRKYYFTAIYLLAQLLLVSCQCVVKRLNANYFELSEYSTDSVDIDLTIYEKDGKYIINDTIDLKRKTLYIPANIHIVMKKGLFKNGCIVGNNTRLEYKNVVFDRVKIKGTWIVPKVKSSMFKTLSYDNSLKDLLALTNSKIKNNVHIYKDDYFLRAMCNHDQCLTLSSNTEIIIDGNIILRPNDFTHYSILHLSGDNITIKGNGIIIGDKKNHLGKYGEWGMGVYIYGGDRVRIEGLTIKDCWGDCVYVTNNSKNVCINNCNLDNGRRQGISVISAESVEIRNCLIQNIMGTDPEYAIDIEPNEDDIVRYVLIDKVKVENCCGGFASYGRAQNAIIDSVVIKNCYVRNLSKCPMTFSETRYVLIDNSKIINRQYNTSLKLYDVDQANVNGLIINDKRLKNDSDGLSRIGIKNVKEYIIK